MIIVRKFAKYLTLLFLFFIFTGCSDVIVPDPNVRYIAFGDSTTAGPTDRNYWHILQEKIGQPADAFAGQGNGGENSTDGLARLESLLSADIYPNAQVLLYWEGGDDLVEFIKKHDPLLLLSPDSSDYPYAADLKTTLDQLQSNIEQAIQTAHDAGLTVYVATYYPMMKNAKCKALPIPILLPSQAVNANLYVVHLNDRIRLAVQNGAAVLVDVGAHSDFFLQDPSNYYDCNHLSETGNTYVADLFAAAIGSP